MKKKYTHIFFDLDNTLWDFNKNSYQALYNAFLHFSIDVHPITYPKFFEVYSKYNQKLWVEYRRQKVVKNELKRLRFQQTFDELEIKGIDADNMNSLYLCEMAKQINLVDGAEEILRYLKNKGYLLFIITNGFKEVQHKKLEATNLRKYFTKVFISEDVKAPKPDRKIFEYAIKSANAPKHKSLMIGDNFEIDIKGAINFGIDAVLFSDKCTNGSQNQKKILKDSDIFRIIESLHELKGFV